jgi:hypothetical protein
VELYQQIGQLQVELDWLSGSDKKPGLSPKTRGTNGFRNTRYRADAFEECYQSPAPILRPREMQNVGLASFPSSTFLRMGSFVRSKRFGFFNINCPTTESFAIELFDRIL